MYIHSGHFDRKSVCGQRHFTVSFIIVKYYILKFIVNKLLLFSYRTHPASSQLFSCVFDCFTIRDMFLVQIRHLSTTNTPVSIISHFHCASCPSVLALKFTFKLSFLSLSLSFCFISFRSILCSIRVR